MLDFFAKHIMPVCNAMFLIRSDSHRVKMTKQLFYRKMQYAQMLLFSEYNNSVVIYMKNNAIRIWNMEDYYNSVQRGCG